MKYRIKTDSNYGYSSANIYINQIKQKCENIIKTIKGPLLERILHEIVERNTVVITFRSSILW